MNLKRAFPLRYVNRSAADSGAGWALLKSFVEVALMHKGTRGPNVVPAGQQLDLQASPVPLKPGGHSGPTSSWDGHLLRDFLFWQRYIQEKMSAAEGG